MFNTNLDILNFGIWKSDSVFQNVWIKNNSADTLSITTVETRTGFFGVKSQLPLKIGVADSVLLKLWFNPDTSKTGYVSDVITIASDTESQRIARQLKVIGQKADTDQPYAVLMNNITGDPLQTRLET